MAFESGVALAYTVSIPTASPTRSAVAGSLVALVGAFDHAGGGGGQVFNIGNVGEVTIRDLAYRVKELAGSSSPVQYVPYDEAYEAGFEDMPRRVPDISKISALVGYRPTVELDEILERVIESFRQQ